MEEEAQARQTAELAASAERDARQAAELEASAERDTRQTAEARAGEAEAAARQTALALQEALARLAHLAKEG